MHVLNPTAAIVWQCLDGTGSVGEIVGDIADVFERDHDEVRDAVLEVVRRFGRQGLLEGVGIAPDDGPASCPRCNTMSRPAPQTLRRVKEPEMSDADNTRPRVLRGVVEEGPRSP